MGRCILVIVLLAALALFAYAGYGSYDAQRTGVTGQVFSGDSSRDRLPMRSTSPTFPSSASQDGASQQETETIVYPPATQPGALTTQMRPSTAASAAGGAQVGVVAMPAQPPARDTVSPNPPNGTIFAGSGRYQLYRQGNITWRLDTETGRSCVLFATDEEWRKPRVYRAGCGST